MKFITFHTEDFYESVYRKHLKPSADLLGLDLKVYKEHNYGDWGLNTRHKAKVIRRALSEWDTVVWLDVDAEVRKMPTLFDEIPEDVDIAVYYLDWCRHWQGIEGQPKRELVNSVMMLRNHPAVMTLLDEWIEGNIGTTTWEQQVFQKLLEEKTNIKIFNLPDTYCAILTYENTVPDYIQDPVIVQHQISRVVREDARVLQPGG